MTQSKPLQNPIDFEKLHDLIVEIRSMGDGTHTVGMGLLVQTIHIMLSMMFNHKEPMDFALVFGSRLDSDGPTSTLSNLSRTEDIFKLFKRFENEYLKDDQMFNESFTDFIAGERAKH